MVRFKAYIKHRLTASNQHGVHSPFVYALVTRCFYARPHFKGTKAVNILLKSIGYFSATRIHIDGNSPQIEERIRQEYGLARGEHRAYDVIYAAHPYEALLSDFKDKVHNDSLILVDQIHKTPNSTQQWNTLSQDRQITVSIDLWYCGLLFFRKEQVKEHFKIRI